MRKRYREKIVSEDQIFSNVNTGDHIFISTGCGEPQYLVNGLTNYTRSHPKAFFDAGVFHVWTLGVGSYTDQKLRHNGIILYGQKGEL